MIEGEIFVEVHWKLSIKVSLSIRELARVCFCVQFEHGFEVAKLKEMN